MKSKKKWIAILMGFGILLTLLLIYFLKQNSKEPTFKTIQVIRGDIKKTILTTGLVQPYNRLEIKPPIAGRAEQILVEEGTTVTKGQILAWMSSTERAVLLDAARAKGPQVLQYWETLYKPTPLIAPLNGMVIAKNIESGQTVTQQDAVLVMSDKLIIKAQVDETDIGEIKIDEKVEAFLDAYPRNKILGHVDHIAYEAKTVNNVTVYEVDIIIDEVPPFMRSGMTSNVTFLISEKENILTLPVEAIQREKRQTFVIQDNPENSKTPLMKEIKVGINDGKKVEIISGLSEGDGVLVKNVSGQLDSSKSQSSNPFSPFGGNRTPRR